MNNKEEIVIGFTEPITDNQEDDDEFPSLLGGEPVWFNNNCCPESVKCQLCQGDMTFLLQLYTPLELEHTYHRALYIFFCRNKSCQNRKESFKVLRFQQKKSDVLTYYKSDKFTKQRLEKSFKIVTDVVDQKETQMLEKEYMKIAKPFDVDDKEFATTFNKKGAPKQNYDKENTLIKQFAQMAMEDPDFGNKFDKLVAESYEDDEDDDDDLDSCFEKFCFLLKKQDSHILRYCRNKDSTPLWYSEKNQWNHIPKCKNCNKNLIFEFQINSSILNHIPSMIELDWGIVAFYTCENSCKSKDISEEHVEIQVVLEKEQIEENLKKHIKNVEKHLGNDEEIKSSEEEQKKDEDDQQNLNKNENKDKEKEKEQKEEEEIPCGEQKNKIKNETGNNTKQKKNKKKKAVQQNQEEQQNNSVEDGEEEGEQW